MFIKKTGDIIEFLNKFADAVQKKSNWDMVILKITAESLIPIFPSIPVSKIMEIFFDEPF